jgi:hypothetical protein
MDLVDMSENVANAGVELVLVDEQLERAAVLGTFLDLMYFGYTLEDTPAAKWPPIDVLCDAVVLADKWEAPLAFSRGLAYVEMWSTRNDDPLPAFRIGARFGKNVMMGVMAGRIIEKDLHLRIEDWPVAYAKDIPGGVIWALVKTASELCHSSGHTCARPDRCNPNATKTAARFAHHVKSLRRELSREPVMWLIASESEGHVDAKRTLARRGEMGCEGGSHENWAKIGN